ncbi:hypothetical protein H4N58_01695 [Mumia sp. ZJ1417]|uniref:Rv3654c family TadE-like protein n=1 Tax=unclassified Mumia TaxID=2621872 RepID=UPI0014233696|nr:MULTISPECIES: Rv3654c family TadE-like protein [unclassified Mumia]QMW66709.1 hypothetical protein H4N58_01695 [Mumia sp. ZJ1417]
MIGRLSALRTEGGAGAVYGLVVVTVFATAFAIAVQVAALARLQHQVTAAADLTALAASGSADGGGDGCAQAERIAAANEVRLRSCALDAAVATVVVERSARTWGVTLTLKRTARAAPRDYVPAAGGGR